MSDPEAKDISGKTAQPANDSPSQVQVLSSTTIYKQSDAQDRKKRFYRKLRHAPIWMEAAAALALVVITWTYTHYAKIQSEQAVISANAAKSAADTAQRTLIASNRPWLDLRPTITGPLTFANDGAHISVKVEISNSGHSPATRVITSQEFIQIINWNPNPWYELKKICDLAGGGSALETNRGLTQVAFPGSPLVDEVSFTLSQSEMSREVVPGHRSPYIYPVIVWCTAYRADFSDTVHRIGYAWNISKRDPTRPYGISFIDPSKGPVRQDELIIYKFPPIGPLAD